MEYILDFTRPTDARFVEVFEQVVKVMLDATNSENHDALKMVERFRQHELAWNRSLELLQLSKDINTRFVVAKVLENIVQEKWQVLAPEYQARVKGQTQRILGSLITDPAVYVANKQLVVKLNGVIVAIAKHDWPAKWPTFIQDLVKASMTNDTICANTLDIIKRISEEVFDYSTNNLTSSKVVDLKKQLHGELRAIYTLCMTKLAGCFDASGQNVKPASTAFAARVLDLFKRIIHWIPVQIVFDTRFLMALMRCFQNRKLSSHAMRCLAEVSAITTLDDQVTPLPAPAKQLLAKLFANVMQLLTKMVPTSSVVRLATTGPEEGQEFIHALCIFFTQFLSNHLPVVLPSMAVVNTAMAYLVEITKADDKDLFSTCMDFWHEFTKSLYNKVMSRPGMADVPLHRRVTTEHDEGPFKPVLHALRCVVISKMVMPEEILIEKEEKTGEIIQRVKTHDTELSALYETAKETLVYLTNLNRADMQSIMNEYLQKQSSPGGFTHNSLNRLCWAIGSISGTLPPNDEKRFLVTVIKELLDLTVAQKGKNNKAVIASNIMYVVGQYPDFLREHWKFLKTVVYKLFEFMKETHPGVQDMACETFLKIAKRCSREFVIPHDATSGHDSATEPFFMATLIRDLDETTSALEPHQVLVFYEAVGCMVAAEKDAARQKELLAATMRTSNEQWKTQLQHPNAQERLQSNEAMAWIVGFLRKNSAICRSLKAGFVYQIGTIYEDLLKVYQFYSQFITSRGATAVGDERCRRARVVKKEVLQLCESFIQGSNQPRMLADKILPSLMSAILLDYKNSHEKIRDAAVLSILSTSIDKLKGDMEKYVAQMLSCVFDVTLPMIMTVSPETGSAFTAFPEVRAGFFKVLASTIRECSRPVFGLPQAAFKLVFDSVMQAILHFDRDIHERGLDMLNDLLTPLAGNMTVCTGFFKNFIQSMLTQLLHVLTDRMHVSGFVKQVRLLLKILQVVESGQLQAPIMGEKFPNNHDGVGQFLMHLIKRSFSERMDDTKIRTFVQAMQQVAREPHPQQAVKFETLMRDFVIELKQFSNQEIAKMNYIKTRDAMKARALQTQQQKRQVPGLLKPEQLFGMAQGGGGGGGGGGAGSGGGAAAAF